MINEQSQTIKDTQAQMAALRQRDTELNERHFVIELQKRNLEIKIKEMQQIMGDLDINVLQAYKKAN